MKNLILVLTVIAAVVGLTWSASLLIGPRPVRLIKLSFFTSPVQMGQLVYTRLRQEMSATSIFAIGIQAGSPFQTQVVGGFLDAWQGDSASGLPRVLRLFVEEGLTTGDFPKETRVDLLRMKDAPEEVWTRIQRALELGERVVLLTHAYFTSHVLNENPISRLEAVVGERIPALTMADFAATSEELEHLEPPCVGSQRDRTGLGDFGCLLRQRSTWYGRKWMNQKSTLARDHYAGALELVRQKDYLLFTKAALNQGASTPRP